MKILVTGCSGFIGTRFQARSRHELYLYDRFTPSNRGRHNIIPFEPIDSTELTQLLRPINVDAIVHMAGAGVDPTDRNLDNLVQTNSILSYKIVELASNIGARCVIVLGSCSEYAPLDSERKIVETDATDTAKAYGTTKACGSSLALMSGGILGVKVIIARLFNVYGPGERPHRLLPMLLSGLSRSEKVHLSSGKQWRDFIYIDDVCEAIDELISCSDRDDFQSSIYNVCTGIGTTVQTFAQLVAKSMGKDFDLLGFGDIELRADDLPYVVGDNSCIIRSTNWRPQTTVALGIEKSILAYGISSRDEAYENAN